MRATSLVAFGAVAALAGPESALAFEKFVAKLPNGDEFLRKGVPALGHKNAATGGGKLNAFGKAFARARFLWTETLCRADSDGDGLTNGEELGDPCCTWTETGNLAYIGGISHPGNASDTANKRLVRSIECIKSGEDDGDDDKKTRKPRRTKQPTPAPTPTPLEDDAEENEDDDDGSDGTDDGSGDADADADGSGSTSTTKGTRKSVRRSGQDKEDAEALQAGAATRTTHSAAAVGVALAMTAAALAVL